MEVFYLSVPDVIIIDDDIRSCQIEEASSICQNRILVNNTHYLYSIVEDNWLLFGINVHQIGDPNNHTVGCML